MSAPKGQVPWNAGTGKGWINRRGYRVIRVGGKVIKEHRYVMECHIGRALLKIEDVHHLNSDKTDNRIENLQLIGHAEHSRLTRRLRSAQR